jgi:ABC-2 type transport system permease protein
MPERKSSHDLRSNLSAMLASARMRFTTITRYPGQLTMDIVIPIVFAYIPILLGQGGPGSDPTRVFEQNTGTSNYIGYMLIGSSTFMIVTLALYHVAYWLRWEQESGTLESLYLTPTPRFWVAGGTALYSSARGVFTALSAYLIGSLVLRVNPLEGNVGLAFLFILVGLIPLYGLTLLFGALIIKVKEANALVGLMQWVVSFLMGVFFPVAFFPPLLRAVALLFPPTWMTNGVRAALLGVGFFFGNWYRDLAVLWVFLLVAPLFGYWVFRRVEVNVRRNEGVGTF